MTFQEFLEKLPTCPGKQQFPVDNKSGGFSYIAQGLPQFVGPDLVENKEVDQPPEPRIIIISAAGAVGKSTLGRQIAFNKKAPIWDLAQADAVGVNSVNGQLTNSFGFSAVQNVTKQLFSGKMFLIVDALDEARVKANEAGFEAFVKNLAELANEASGITFVLLGRTQTAENSWLLLAEAKVSTSLLSIQPFTRSQAEEYIDLRIEHSKDNSALKRMTDHRKPFEQARDMVFDHLEKAGGKHENSMNDTMREFLGYAPVLETIAVLLIKESNYAEFTANLERKLSSSSESNPLEVLNHVVTNLLDREQKDKLVKNIEPALKNVAEESGWNDWDSLYLPEEQRKRLLGKILDYHFDYPLQIPDAVRTQYEEKLKAWLPEHPFLREGSEPANKVFESYLFATALYEHPNGLGPEVERYVNDVAYKPSRLLADFYRSKKPDVVPANYIGLLYDSFLAGETESFRIRLSVDCGDPNENKDDHENGEGEFELVYTALGTEEDERIERYSFKLAEGHEIITFQRRLKDADITTSGTVCLGGGIDDYEIGPSVNICCGTLLIKSSGFVVQTSRVKNQDEAVVLEASSFESTFSGKPLVRGKLLVRWPGAEAFPWNDYANISPDISTDDMQMHEAYRRLRRIITCFRSNKRGGLARHKDKITSARVLRKSGQIILDELLKDKILILKGKFYQWKPDDAGQLLGITWDELQKQKASSKLRDYLQNIINNNPGLF